MAVLGDTNGRSRVQQSKLFWGLLGLALAATATAVVVAGGLSDQDEPVGAARGTESAVAESGSGSQGLVTAEETVLIRLAEAGIIPMAAVDWDTIELKKAVEKGLVPAQALQPAAVSVDPIYTSEELATIDAALRGLIPSQAVDWDLAELKRLISQGLIPRAAAP